MLTTGGVFYEEGQEAILLGCGLKDLFFFRPGTDSYEINVPNLTPREIRYLDFQLPLIDVKSLEAEGIEPAQLVNYAELYRYYPLYVQTDG